MSQPNYVVTWINFANGGSSKTSFHMSWEDVQNHIIENERNGGSLFLKKIQEVLGAQALLKDSTFLNTSKINEDDLYYGWSIAKIPNKDRIEPEQTIDIELYDRLLKEGCLEKGTRVLIRNGKLSYAGFSDQEACNIALSDPEPCLVRVVGVERKTPEETQLEQRAVF